VSSRYDVLILGAGAAGLRAAQTLAAAGRRVAVIEARNRIGGRILTRHVKPAAETTIPVELGAEFVHGLPVQTWSLVREAELDSYELDGSQLLYADGRLQSPAEEHGAAMLLHRMTEWVSQQPSGADATFEHYLDLAGIDGADRRSAVNYVEGFNAADHRRISVASLSKQQDAEERIAADRLFHISAGYDSIPRFLAHRIAAAGAMLFLEKPVHTIEWRPGRVTMSGIDGRGCRFEFVGDKAVITLPLGVLQAGSVRFVPTPGRVLTEASTMAMGKVVRLPMLFRSRFWSDAPVAAGNPRLLGELSRLSFLFADRATPPTWWTSHPSTVPMLTGWIGGPDASMIERESMIERFLKSLADIFGLAYAGLQNELVGAHFHDWSADSYARGAYSYVPAGALAASGRIAEPVERTLYFAGEHTTESGHWGTVHGALDSGSAAAGKIITPP